MICHVKARDANRDITKVQRSRVTAGSTVLIPRMIEEGEIGEGNAQTKMEEGLVGGMLLSLHNCCIPVS